MKNSGFDAGVYTAQRWRAARRWALLVSALILFVETQGMPHLRIAWEGIDKQRVSVAQYWSVTGIRVERMDGIAPLITLQPLERSVFSYGRQALKGLVSSLEQ